MASLAAGVKIVRSRKFIPPSTAARTVSTMDCGIGAIEVLEPEADLADIEPGGTERAVDHGCHSHQLPANGVSVPGSLPRSYGVAW